LSKWVNFSTTSTNSDPATIFNLFFKILKIDLQDLINEFVFNYTDLDDPIQDFVDSFNTEFNLSLQIDTEKSEAILEDIIEFIQLQDINIYGFIYDKNINDAQGDVETILETLKELLRTFTSRFTVET